MREDRIIVGSDRRKKRTILGRVVACHDCGQLGYAALTRGLHFTLPPGWKMVWCGFKPLFICGSCCEKRRAAYFGRDKK